MSILRLAFTKKTSYTKGEFIEQGVRYLYYKRVRMEGNNQIRQDVR